MGSGSGGCTMKPVQSEFEFKACIACSTSASVASPGNLTAIGSSPTSAAVSVLRVDVGRCFHDLVRPKPYLVSGGCRSCLGKRVRVDGEITVAFCGFSPGRRSRHVFSVGLPRRIQIIR